MIEESMREGRRWGQREQQRSDRGYVDEAAHVSH
jgi:hypothetical protein